MVNNVCNLCDEDILAGQDSFLTHELTKGGLYWVHVSCYRQNRNMQKLEDCQVQAPCGDKNAEKLKLLESPACRICSKEVDPYSSSVRAEELGGVVHRACWKVYERKPPRSDRGSFKTLDPEVSVFSEDLDLTKCRRCGDTFTFGPIYKGMHLECYTKFEETRDTTDLKIQLLIDAIRLCASGFLVPDKREAKLAELEDMLDV